LAAAENMYMWNNDRKKHLAIRAKVYTLTQCGR